MPKKLHRCVRKVSKDPGVDNPWAVCNASMKRKKRKKKAKKRRKTGY